MNSIANPPSRRSGKYMMAVVLGTALSALGPSTSQAALPESCVKAVTDISRYCNACWRNARLHPDCWPDCTQEVFSRLLERVSVDSWNRLLRQDGEDRRELIRAIDAVKKRTQRGRKHVTQFDSNVVDRREPDRQLREERRQLVQSAAEKLATRQQRIVQLSLDGWSVQEIADEMRLPPERVSDEKYKAIRKLRQQLA